MSSLKEKTAHGLYWGTISQASQQLLNLLFGICLARLLTPADYGMVGMLTLFSAIASALQEGGFQAALANRKNPDDRDYNSVFWVNILIGITAYVVLFCCAPLIARFFKTPELTALARFQFLGFVIASFNTAQSGVLFKNLMVRQRAYGIITANLVAGIVGVAMAWLGFAYWGLATQNLVFIGTIAVMNWHFSPWRPSLRIDFGPVREMFGFSSRLLLTNVFLQFNNYFFSVVLGRLYRPDMVGYFTQANKWSTMGSSLIDGTVSSVAQPVLAEVADDRERQLQVFRKMLRFTAFISFPALFGLALIAREFIIITVTDKWAYSIPILQVLCLWGAFFPISRLYTNLIISRGSSHIYMWGTMALGLLQLAVVVFSMRLGILGAIAVYTVINILWLAVWHRVARRMIGIRLLDALADILPFALIAGAVMGVTWFATQGITNLKLLIIAKILLAAVLYIVVMLAARVRIFAESFGFLLQKFGIKSKHLS
jgi:O-antigen/teichoic acid export membrane protein